MITDDFNRADAHGSGAATLTTIGNNWMGEGARRWDIVRAADLFAANKLGKEDPFLSSDSEGNGKITLAEWMTAQQKSAAAKGKGFNEDAAKSAFSKKIKIRTAVCRSTRFLRNGRENILVAKPLPKRSVGSSINSNHWKNSEINVAK